MRRKKDIEPPRRQRIDLDDLDLPDAVDLAIEGLARGDVFQREGRLVDVVRTAVPDADGGIVRPLGAPRIRLTPKPRIREQLMLTCDFRRRVEGKLLSVDPPAELVNALVSRGEWPHVRILTGIAEWPVLRADGTILSTPGYDAKSSVIYEPRVTVEIPDAPTREDARAAVDELQELISDFPFASGEGRSAWIAGLLTLLARPAIAGPAPLVLIDANERGSGKTLLADLYGAIVTGKSLPRRTAPDDPAEWRKTITSIAIAADPIILIDNVTRMLRSDALDAVLTGTAFRDRLLGRNEEIALDVRTLFVATANNAMISADLVRRSLHVRLESQVERPEQRSGFRFPDLLGEARENRAKYIRAGLTILRAYALAGRPAVELRPMGSYEDWTRVVRAAGVWAGLPDPASTQDALRSDAEPEHEELGALLRAWHEHYGERAVSTSAVLTELRRHVDVLGIDSLGHVRDALTTLCDCAPGELPTPRRLGNELRSLRGRIVNGLMVVPADRGVDGRAWRVRAA